MTSEASNRPEIPNGRRSNSLVGGFIKRSKSNDLLGERKTSSSLTRNKLTEEEDSKPAAPPRLPSFSPQPQLQTFGGENYVPKMPPNTTDTPPVPPLPAGISDATKFDPHARTQSMTHRGRYSYANSTISSLNSPRRVRRRKDPTPYNVLVIGARNSGKTSFVNFLKSSIAHPSTQATVRNPELDNPPPSAKLNRGAFVQHYLEIEMETERIGLSLWDSQGFEKNVIDLQLREMSTFVESKFEDTFIEEMKVVRAPGVRDTHIHCVFLVLDPSKLDSNIQAAQQTSNGATSSIYRPSRVIGAFEEDFELQIMKTLQGKTTIIPVISKADTITTTRMTYLKKMVWESLMRAGLNPMEALDFESSESEEESEDDIEDEEVDSEAEEIPAGTTATGGGDNSVPSEVGNGETGNTQGTTSAGVQAGVKASHAHKRGISSASVSATMFKNGVMPMAILSPDQHAPEDNGPVGRKFAWGFADPYNAEHCDFVKLKEACFGDWRAELREASREVFYERWRTSRLNQDSTLPVKKQAAAAPAIRKTSGIPIELSRSQGRY